MPATGRFSLLLVALAFLSACMSCSEDPPPVSPPPSAPDTTSHDFVWDKTPIGIRQTLLLCITAVNDTDVWIGGEIHTVDTDKPDSLGREIPPFNAAHWNGREWKLYYFPWPTGNGKDTGFAFIEAIHHVSSSEIWLLGGGNVGKWDGKKLVSWWIPWSASSGASTHLWGREGDLYMTGELGTMTHFDGSTFMRIPTGTGKNVQDVWSAGELTMCIASGRPSTGDPEPLIMKVRDGRVEQWNDSTLQAGYQAIWFDVKGALFVAGASIRKWTGKTWNWQNVPTNMSLYCIRGNAANDVMAAGVFSTVLHYNGRSWKAYPEIDPTQRFNFNELAFIGDDVWIIGYDISGLSAVFHGRRGR